MINSGAQPQASLTMAGRLQAIASFTASPHVSLLLERVADVIEKAVLENKPQEE